MQLWTRSPIGNWDRVYCGLANDVYNWTSTQKNRTINKQEEGKSRLLKRSRLAHNRLKFFLVFGIGQIDAATA